MIRADLFLSFLWMMPKATLWDSKKSFVRCQNLENGIHSFYTSEKLIFFINYPFCCICFLSRKQSKIYVRTDLIIFSPIKIKSPMSALAILAILPSTNCMQRFWLLHTLIGLSVLIYSLRIAILIQKSLQWINIFN